MSDSGLISRSLNGKNTSKKPRVLTVRRETVISAFLIKTLKRPHKYDLVGSPNWITMVKQMLREPPYCRSSESDIEEWLLNSPSLKNLVDQIHAAYKKHGNTPKSKRTCRCCSSISRSSSKQHQPWSSVLEAVNLVRRRPEGRKESKDESPDCQLDAVKPPTSVNAKVTEDKTMAELGSTSPTSRNVKRTRKEYKAGLTEEKENVIYSFLTKSLELPHKYDPVGSPEWKKVLRQLLYELEHCKPSEKDIEGWLELPRFSNIVDKIRKLYKKQAVPKTKRTCLCCSSSSRLSSKQQQPRSNILEAAASLVSGRSEGRMESKEESSVNRQVQVEAVNPAAQDAEVKEGEVQLVDEDDASSGSASASLDVQHTSNKSKVLTEQEDKIISAFLTKTLRWPHEFDPVGSQKWITKLKQFLGEREQCNSSESDIERWLKLPRFSNLVDQIRAAYKKYGKTPKSKRTCRCCSSSLPPSQKSCSNILEDLNLVLRQLKGHTESKQESADSQVEAGNPAASMVDAEKKTDDIPVYDVDDSSSVSEEEYLANHQKQVVFQFSNADELLSKMISEMMAIVERSRTNADKGKDANAVRKWEKVYRSLNKTKMSLTDGEE